jgi:hypothetical protein
VDDALTAASVAIKSCAETLHTVEGALGVADYVGEEDL